MRIVVFTAEIKDGAEDIGDGMGREFQSFVDANYSGPGRLVTIRTHEQMGSGMRADILRAAAFDTIVNVIRLADAAVKDNE